MITPALPICPQCKQSDQVQKVSAVYGLNTKEWIETQTVRDRQGRMRQEHESHQAHTQLGLQLKPPEKPATPAHPGIWYGLGVFGVLFLLSFLCPFIIIPILIVVGVLAEAPVIPGIASLSDGTLLAVGGVVLLLVVAGLVVAGILVKRRYARAMAGYGEKKTRYEREDLPRWEQAMQRWNEMYLCLRDETVFLPEEQKVIRVDEVQNYLHDYLNDPFYQR